MTNVRITVLTGTIALWACASAPPVSNPGAPIPPQRSGPRVVGYYYGATSQRGFPVSAIQAEKLTHIVYAFGEVREDGSVAVDNPSFDVANFEAIKSLKQRTPQLQVLIALGGWGGSKYFSNAASTPEMRTRFAQSVVDVFFKQYPGVFDGVDIDWEYPVSGGEKDNIHRPEDKQNLSALVEELRRRLDAYAGSSRKHYLITIAAPAGAGQLAKFEMARLGNLLDFINVMTYDFHTGGTAAHFNAPLGSPSDDPSPNLNVQKSVDAFLAVGVPANKIVVGVPFYGYGYAGVATTAAGRFQPIDKTATTDSITRKRWTGALRYNQLGAAITEGFERHWDDVARVPWLYNSKTRIFITYDDPRSIGEKAAYVRNKKLGGIMIWELSGDDGALLTAINQSLIAKSPNR
ncbi:MAG TPA: glycoside hydrolase family 18 protein [Longimicrobiales bacterium]|nr:glycoside hydrolase family 18 protein [Longimicrobiales bacterium]